MKKAILFGFVAVALASCSATTSDPRYAKLSEREYQIPGHKWKSAKECDRRAPIGKFDAKCDIPVVGIRNFSDPTINVQSGGIGGLGVGGM